MNGTLAEEYSYDWSYGRIRLNWLTPNVAIARAHDNIDQIPGPYNCVMTVYVEQDKYEIMGFMGKCPSKEEFRHFYDYMKSLGLKKSYRRFKGK